MKRSGSKSRSQRQLRIGEVLRYALVRVLERGEARDPGLEGVSITVTEVQISPDFRNATAFVMPLGGTDADIVLESLTRAAPFFRRVVASEIDMRRLPALTFQLDHSFDNAGRIDVLLRSHTVVADLDSGPDDHPSSAVDGPK